MEKQSRIFISYSRASQDFAIKLTKELKSEGLSAWLDQLDIPLGARWDDEVHKALVECEIFLLIMTPASVASENVKDEIGYAIDNHKRIMPVLLENCEIPFRLRRFQYVDFTKKSFDDGVQSVKELLRSLLAQLTIPDGEIPADTQDQSVQAEMDRKVKEEADRRAAQKAEASPKNFILIDIKPIKSWLQVWWKRGIIAFIVGEIVVFLALALGGNLGDYGYWYVLTGYALAWGAFGFLFYPQRISYILAIVLCITGFLIFLIKTREGLTDSMVLGSTAGFILSAIFSRVLHVVKKIKILQ